MIPFELYQKYDGLKDLIRKYIHVTADVLMLGCGNSGEGTVQSFGCELITTTYAPERAVYFVSLLLQVDKVEECRSIASLHDCRPSSDTFLEKQGALYALLKSQAASASSCSW